MLFLVLCLESGALTLDQVQSSRLRPSGRTPLVASQSPCELAHDRAVSRRPGRTQTELLEAGHLISYSLPCSIS